jgi:hypothetical protein
MNNGATEDIREAELLPLVDQVLRGGPAPNPRDQAMLDTLDAWRATGGNRIDADLDGFTTRAPGP